LKRGVVKGVKFGTLHGDPQRFAAALLKLAGTYGELGLAVCDPQRFAAALLKHAVRRFLALARFSVIRSDSLRPY